MAKVSLRAYNREIEAMIDRNHLDEAVAHCQHILKTFPKHLETYRLLGKAYLEAKRHNEAVDIFSRVLAAEPNDFVAHVGMGIVRDEQGKLDDAIWHMERAFEVQSANPAIQGELQRLYGRRDGVQPPRIRMTRGALAHMYMRGELYPQAISETKSVLEEDQGRSDMQVLLARAYYKSGQKKDAADAASTVLKRYPFCLDANLVLAEILGADRPESAQAYRRRVIELDPYAAQAADSLFRSNEVSDAAVSLEHLDWNGQPVGMSTDWASTRAIELESGISDREAQPEWMKASFADETPLSAPAFDSEQETSASPAQPADDIPDFLRAAGWGASSGAFDESKSSAMFDDEPAPPAEPIAEGELPDWVKAMAPQETTQPAEEQEEELPDWINKIGSAEVPIPSADATSDEGTDWMRGLGEPSTPATEEQPDWMKDFGQEAQPAPVTDEGADWMKDLVAGEQPAAEPSDEQPDWMKGFEQEEQPLSASADQPEWLKDIDVEAVSSQPSSDSDFLEELTRELGEPASTETSAPKIDTGSLGTSDQEQDDSFAWLENLAEKQGATEGLLTKPEERLEDEPDWIKQAKSLSQPPMEEPVQEAPAAVSSIDTDSLGTSERERDDSFAWLEALAAKQGASEGLLTKPEERLEQEPEWVQRVKKSTGELQSVPEPQPPEKEDVAVEPEPVSSIEQQQPPVEEVPAAEPEPVAPPSASVEELGKSEAERDDSFAWLESLAARQGASEGLLTKPEERLEQEPEWVQKVKKATGELHPPDQQLPVGQPPVEEEEFVPEPEPAAEALVPTDDVTSWLKSLEEEEAEAEPAAPVVEGGDTAAWFKSLDEPQEKPLDSTSEELPVWMQDVSEEEAPVSEPVTPTEEADVSVESAAPVQGSASEDLPGWLSGLEEEEQPPVIPASDDLPAWMRDETGELVAEPTRIEPTRTTDWTPVDEVKEEEAVTPPSAPEPETPKSVPAPKAKKPAPKKEVVKSAPPDKPYKEPATRRATETTMPIDPVLGSARSELSRSNIPGALDAYGKLIKKGRFLEEVIFDLREALYRYPVEVSIWQSLGDAYMRSNQLQDALDAYTKAEELLR